MDIPNNVRKSGVLSGYVFNFSYFCSNMDLENPKSMYISMNNNTKNIYIKNL